MNLQQNRNCNTKTERNQQTERDTAQTEAGNSLKNTIQTVNKLIIHLLNQIEKKNFSIKYHPLTM